MESAVTIESLNTVLYRYHRAVLTFLILTSFSSVALAYENDLDLVYGDEELVSIATGIIQPLEKAPAVASVINAKEIALLGATDLDEVLETIPGLHVSFDANSYRPIYTFRGIYTTSNPQVLLLVNGIAINDLLLGNQGSVWGGMPLKMVSRIEVIRGPGSAIYGADAFAGVINVVTKAPSKNLSSEIGVRVGSFNTRDAWALHGGNFNENHYIFGIELHDTDGQREEIKADAQTIFDNAFGTGASLAPGPVNLSRKNVDLKMQVDRGPWTVQADLQSRRDFGNGAGVAYALDPNNRYQSDRHAINVKYDIAPKIEHLDISILTAYRHTTVEVNKDLILFPPGADIGLGAPFPNGVIGNPEHFEEHSEIGATAVYTAFNDHIIRVGLGYNRENMYKVKESKNFSFDGSIVPGSSVTNITDKSAIFLQEGDRENQYLFLQDIWTLASDWELTSGLRYDHYSSHGDTVNPRLALVWSSNYNLTTKFLYGRAFRAPAFAETRAQNNPVALGNITLDPETLESTELAFDYDFTQNLNFVLSLFYYEWDDIIRFIPDVGGLTNTAQNTGTQIGKGVEFEFAWDINAYLELQGNYAHQTATTSINAERPHNSPKNQLYLRLVWRITPQWHLTSQVNRVMDRARLDSDIRPKPADYSTVDLALRSANMMDHWGFSLVVKNALDKAAFEPTKVEIPNDLPLARRSVLAGVSYQF